MRYITGAERRLDLMPTEDLLERRGMAARAIAQAVLSIARNDKDIIDIDKILTERGQDEAR